MEWEGREESGNVEDRRGMSGQSMAIGGGALGLVAVLVGLFFGIDIRKFIGGGPGNPGAGPVVKDARPRDANEERLAKFSRTIFRDTEIIWGEIFQKQLGKKYTEPTLVIYDDQTPTDGCGNGQAAFGPFYCPADSRVYIDLDFYTVLDKQLGAPGEFARAYVLAHEVGHHVQRLLGYSARVDQARRTGNKVEANHASVRLELQADFLAGVWAHHAQKRFNFLHKGDIETATNAAYKIGDDYLQSKSGRGRVSPDSFTHGTSKQRQRWFLEGFRTGDVKKASLLFDLRYEEL